VDATLAAVAPVDDPAATADLAAAAPALLAAVNNSDEARSALPANQPQSGVVVSAVLRERAFNVSPNQVEAFALSSTQSRNQGAITISLWPQPKDCSSISSTDFEL
jgi:uncharacterized protein YfaQ (DUF2300 family)